MGKLLSFILDREEQFKRTRLASLYSDFRYLQAVNPDGYKANISAWRKALTDAAREGCLPAAGRASDLLILHTGPELLQSLESKEWGRPLALGTVLREYLQSKQMFTLQEFLTRPESIYYRPWIITPLKVLEWGLRQLGLRGGAAGEDKMAVGSFVLVSNVELCASNILEKASRNDKIDRIFSRKLFEIEFGGSLSSTCPLTASDIDVVLVYLKRDKRMLFYNSEVVKFVDPGETGTTITPEDTAIAALKSLITEQSTQLSTLGARIEELSRAAQRAVANKKRPSALAALRSKKLAEGMLTKVSTNVVQLEEILNSIQQASDQVATVKAMEASTRVLQSLRKEVGGIEKVEEVVQQLGDEMAQVQEVNNLVSELGQVSAGDDLDIDEELDALQQAETEEKAKLEDARTAEKLAALHSSPHADFSETGTTPSLAKESRNTVESTRLVALSQPISAAKEGSTKTDRPASEGHDEAVAAT